MGLSMDLNGTFLYGVFLIGAVQLAACARCRWA